MWYFPAFPNTNQSTLAGWMSTGYPWRAIEGEKSHRTLPPAQWFWTRVYQCWWGMPSGWFLSLCIPGRPTLFLLTPSFYSVSNPGKLTPRGRNRSRARLGHINVPRIHEPRVQLGIDGLMTVDSLVQFVTRKIGRAGIPIHRSIVGEMLGRLLRLLGPHSQHTWGSLSMLRK